MADWNHIDAFSEALAEKVHNLGSDTLKVYLTNTAPDAADATKADLPTEIANGNGYTTGGLTLTVSSSSQTDGDYKLVVADLTITASGATMATWRYAVIYNDTAANDEVLGWYDNGSAASLADGESITIDFSAVDGMLQINKAA